MFRANQFFKLGNVARLSEPTALAALRAERRWRIRQSEKVIYPAFVFPALACRGSAENRRIDQCL